MSTFYFFNIKTNNKFIFIEYMIHLKKLFTEIAVRKNFEIGDIIRHEDDEWRIIGYESGGSTVKIQHIMTGAIFRVETDSLSTAELVDEEILSPMKLVSEKNISEDLKYHISNGLSLTENIFRTYSESYFKLINEVRDLYLKNLIKLCEVDAELVDSDIGKTDFYEGRKVYLDAPVELDEDYVMEAEYRGKKVDLNKPFRTPGESKKYAVYVKNKKGNVVKVKFGDPNLKGNWNDKAAQKSFVARHKCHLKKDKTSPGYWSCRSHRIKSLGNKGKGRYW